MRLSRWILLLCVLAGMPRSAAAEDEPHALALGKRMPAGRVVDALREAAARDDEAAIRALAASAWPDPFEVAARMLFPLRPGAQASDADRAALKRFANHASDETGVAAFLDHWLSADAAAFAAERELWRVTARMTMRLRAHKPASALEAAAEVRTRLPEMRHSHQGPLAWLLTAHALRQLGRAEEAVAELEALVRHATTRRWPAIEGRARHALVLAYRAAGRSDVTLLEACKAAAQRLERARTWHALSSVLGTLASTELRLGRRDAAEETAYRALVIASQAKQASQVLQHRLLLADIADARGRDAGAATLRQQVFDEARQGSYVDAAATAAFDLCLAHLGAGEVAAAMRYGDWLEDHRARCKRPSTKGDAAIALGDLAYWRGEPELARTRYREAVALHTGTTPARLLSSLGRLMRLPGTPDAGVVAKYRVTARQAATARDTVSVLADWSKQEMRLGNLEEAARLARRAVHHADSMPDLPTAWTGRLQLARVYVASEQYEKAEGVLASLLANLPPSTSVRAMAMQVQARCAVAKGQHERAVHAYREAVEAQQRQRRGVADREALHGRAAEHGLAMDGLTAAARWHAADGGAPALEAAWWFREAACGRLLANAISSPHPAHAENHALRQALADVEQRHRAVVIAVLSGDVDRAQRARASLKPAYAHLARIEARLDRRVVSDAPTEPPTLAQVRTSLSGDTALIAFAMGGDSVYGLVVTQERTTFARLGARSEVEKRVRGWKRLASAPGGPEAKLAARLHETLLAPFAKDIASRSRWIVLPDGVLNGVTIDAWLRKGKHGIERIVERHTVTYAQAEAVRGALRTRERERGPVRGAIVLGDPTPPAASSNGAHGLPLQRLAASGDEARRVAALYPEAERQLMTGDEATRARWLEALTAADTPLDCLHLACHGLIHDDLPSLSGLLFANGDVLTAERLQGMRFAADLAVLSACRSGGETVATGEGVLGLTRALFEAGVTRLVATTWQVADKSTADLMVRFHEGRRRQGLSAAQALRAARLALLRSPETAHPYYWAGFQLWGP